MTASVSTARTYLHVGAVLLLLALGVAGGEGVAEAQSRTFTVKNNCSYTIYPGIYPASTHSNGGWQMAPGAQVTFSVPNGSNGRLWGRTGCNGASPAQCATGSCGGTGLQCAGTTGFPNTSLFEWNINAAGTDWYNVSYVDAVDSPIGVQVTNASCVSPNTCSSAVQSNCPADLRQGNVCLSPCTRYNTDQYCCRGAFGNPETCIVANWAASARQYVDNIHNYCPRMYSYAYDEIAGGALHTCPTGASYTITFCPSGGGPQPDPGQPDPNRWYNLVNAASNLCVDNTGWGTADGTPVQQYGCGSGQANQQWRFVPTDNGYYGVVSRHAPWLALDVTGGAGATGQGVKVQLWGWGPPGGANQQWKAESLGGGRFRLRARHSNRCLDVPNASGTNGLQLQQWDCNNTNAQAFTLVAQ